jgi:hypothetical protein
VDIGSLGLNLALIAGIIALTGLVKKLDKKGTLSRYYVLIPLVLGIVGAVCVTTPLSWQGVGVNAIIYAGIASYLYNAGKKLTIAGVTIDPSPEAEPSASATAIAGAVAAEPAAEAADVPKATP